MAARNTRMEQIGSTTVAMVRADAPLYLFIAVYTIVGLSILDLADASNQSAYAIYVGRWLLLFAFMLPAIALLLDYARLVHRVDRRRSLAGRHVFSVARLGRLFSGMVLLQAMVLFQGTFTSLKNVLPLWQGGFLHDGVQADIDRLLHFGVDPWRWLYRVGAHDWIRAVVEWNYNVLWFVVCFSALFYVATSPRAEGIRVRYLFSFMLVWIVLGNLLAGLFISAGPAFYGLVTGDEARFAEQLAFLARSADSPNSAASYQAYLWHLHATGEPGFGSGISAFPSVHVGLITLNALFFAERGRKLGIAAFVYVALIIASSVYLGWHYAIDGYVAVAVVLAIYFALRKLAVPLVGAPQRPAAAAEPAEAATAS